MLKKIIFTSVLFLSFTIITAQEAPEASNVTQRPVVQTTAPVATKPIPAPVANPSPTVARPASPKPQAPNNNIPKPQIAKPQVPIEEPIQEAVATPQETPATSTQEITQDKAVNTSVIKYLAAGLAVGLACIAGGMAVGKIGSAAMGAMSENAELSGKALPFVGLAEGICLWGFLVALLILIL